MMKEKSKQGRGGDGERRKEKKKKRERRKRNSGEWRGNVRESTQFGVGMLIERVERT